jgi:hypothetical protein
MSQESEDDSWVCLLCLFPPLFIAFVICDVIVWLGTGRKKDLLDILDERKWRKRQQEAEKTKLDSLLA